MRIRHAGGGGGIWSVKIMGRRMEDVTQRCHMEIRGQTPFELLGAARGCFMECRQFLGIILHILQKGKE